jgi:hypothetical protein
VPWTADQRRHGALRFFVATAGMRDLLFRAIHLFVAAKILYAAALPSGVAPMTMVEAKVGRQQAKFVASADVGIAPEPSIEVYFAVTTGVVSALTARALCFC